VWSKKPKHTTQKPDNYENSCNNKGYMKQPTQSAEENETQQPQNEDNNSDNQ